MTATPITRPIPPPLAGEREMLENWLEFHRSTLALKCADLDDLQVRTASAEPSQLTLLGLVRHAAEVERRWFQVVFAGRNTARIYAGGEGTGGESTGDAFALPPDQGIEEALAVWRTEIETGRELIAGAPLDAEGRVPEPESAVLGERVSLRWILHHMIEEYARHNGQADLLRERIDGVTGL